MNKKTVYEEMMEDEEFARLMVKEDLILDITEKIYETFEVLKKKNNKKEIKIKHNPKYDPRRTVGFDSGDFLIYIGCDEDQINFSNHDDPREKLIIGNKYEVMHIDVYFRYVKIYLKDFPEFNFKAAWFKLDQDHN